LARALEIRDEVAPLGFGRAKAFDQHRDLTRAARARQPPTRAGAPPVDPVGARWILTSRVADDRTFSFANVPPGEYWLAPVDDAEPGEWFDPTFLQRIEPTAIKLTIGEGEKKTQDLRVGGG
jgi:hypothetical protein